MGELNFKLIINLKKKKIINNTLYNKNQIKITKTYNPIYNDYDESNNKNIFLL